MSEKKDEAQKGTTINPELPPYREDDLWNTADGKPPEVVSAILRSQNQQPPEKIWIKPRYVVNDIQGGGIYHTVQPNDGDESVAYARVDSPSTGKEKSDVQNIIEWLEHRCDYGPPCGKCTYCSIARTIPQFDSGHKPIVVSCASDAERVRSVVTAYLPDDDVAQQPITQSILALISEIRGEYEKG